METIDAAWPHVISTESIQSPVKLCIRQFTTQRSFASKLWRLTRNSFSCTLTFMGIRQRKTFFNMETGQTCGLQVKKVIKLTHHQSFLSWCRSSSITSTSMTALTLCRRLRSHVQGYRCFTSCVYPSYIRLKLHLPVLVEDTWPVSIFLKETLKM